MSAVHSNSINKQNNNTIRKGGGVDKNIVILTGNANPELAKKICAYLRLPPGKEEVKQFSDGEIQIEIDEHIRCKDVFIVQSTCNTFEGNSVNDNLIELCLMFDACKRSSVRRITAVIPYFGYARQDKKVRPRVPISARLMADMITLAGANRVITMDLHANQIQGFFNIPVDNLFARPVLIKHIKDNFSDNLVIVSPDAGGTERARAYAKEVNADLAIIDKRRSGPNKAEAMAVIGDVKDKIAVIVDDIVDTAGTLNEAREALITAGAIDVYAYCAHAVLSGPAIKRITASGLKLITTDTIPLSPKAQACKNITVLTISELFGEAIIRSHRGKSVESLFE